MLRNLLVTFERFTKCGWHGVDEERMETFTERYNTIEQAKGLENENEEYGYKILDSKILSEPELNQCLIDETNQYNRQFIKLHKIGNLQIIEYLDKWDEKEVMLFRAHRDYEEINCRVYNSLEECLLNAMKVKDK
jgi:hypothetical protein